MKLGTLRADGHTVAVRIDDQAAVEINGAANVGQLLADSTWRDRATNADGVVHELSAIEPNSWDAVIPAPSKIVCVGLNYRNHILEMGRELPEYPTLFAKYAEALIGPYDIITLPTGAADQVDWEGELALIIGSTTRRVDEATAGAHIAGYAVLNDVTMRDYQYRTTEWFQGKTFEKTTPLGPWMTTTDSYNLDTELRTVLDDELMQHTLTDGLVFGPEALVSYISQIFTLNPGDVIATGTPGGVGHARKPPRYLRSGQTLRTSIDGLGELVNPVRAER